MSEPTPDVPPPDYDERGVPSLEHLRDRIEGRYTTALGAQELAEGDRRVQDQVEREADREKKAADRLEEIRRSLG